METVKELNKSRITVKQKLLHLELKEEEGVKTVPSSSSHLVLSDELSFTSLIGYVWDKTLPFLSLNFLAYTYDYPSPYYSYSLLSSVRHRHTDRRTQRDERAIAETALS